MDPFESFKSAQKQMWPNFAPYEVHTTPCAAKLIAWAGVRAEDRVLDVACGTGVVSVTAARLGARVTGLDLTPELLDRAVQNAEIAGVQIEWREGDAEQLPFADASYDVVLSQFGHIFAPRPEVAIDEMLRVLKPGGTIGFSTWPPDLFVGRMFTLTASYLPPPPPGVAPPPLWGDPSVIRQRLGSRVKDIQFDYATMWIPALSIPHQRMNAEKSAGAVVRLVATLEKSDPAKLEKFRKEYDALAGEYFENNLLRQQFLITRATKV
jgi:SAM-dependent methyltransferase